MEVLGVEYQKYFIAGQLLPSLSSSSANRIKFANEESCGIILSGMFIDCPILKIPGCSAASGHIMVECKPARLCVCLCVVWLLTEFEQKTGATVTSDSPFELVPHCWGSLPKVKSKVVIKWVPNVRWARYKSSCSTCCFIASNEPTALLACQINLVVLLFYTPDCNHYILFVFAISDGVQVGNFLPLLRVLFVICPQSCSCCWNSLTQLGLFVSFQIWKVLSSHKLY